MVYCCYIRPIEILRLKVKEVFLDTHTIYIPGPKFKNGKDGYLLIPARPYDALVAMELDTKDPDDYLFGNYSLTKDKNSTVDARKEYKTRITDQFAEVFKKLNITDRSLYSFKNTGVVAAYNAWIKVKPFRSSYVTHHW